MIVPLFSKREAIPVIHGERVVLREFRKEDVAPIQAWVGNEEITRYLGFVMFPQSLEETTSFVERQLVRRGTPDEGVFVIALRDDPSLEYVGAVGLHGISWRDRHCELGIVIGREDLLGKGLGTEAIRLALGFAFDFLNMHKVNLTVFEYNERGRRCYTKCGFKEEGRIREQRFYNGHYWDVIIMGITREEFAAVAR
jgi:RimJ/RimL family protein N-acetyltransferase